MKTVSQIANSFHEPHHPPRLWASRPHHKPDDSEENRECNAWMEIRRELLRAEKTRRLTRLDAEERRGFHSFDFRNFASRGFGLKQDGQENPPPLTQLSMATSSCVRKLRNSPVSATRP